MLQNFRRWLSALPYQDPIQQRLAPILQYVLIGLIAVSAVGLLILVMLFGLPALSPSVFFSYIGFALFMAVGLALLRRGHFNSAVWILLATILMAEAIAIAGVGLDEAAEAKMLSAITLALAGLLLNRRALAITLVLTIIMSVFLDSLPHISKPSANASSVSSFVLTLLTLSFFFYLIGQSFREALAASVDRQKLLEQEIDRRKRFETDLVESESRFRTMSDTSPVLIWMSGTDSECNFVNKTWMDFTGRQFEQEIGTGWMSGIYSADVESFSSIYSTAFEKRETFSLEFRLRRKDGLYGWVLAQGTPRTLNDGTFAGYIGSCVDISTRVEAEERTRLLQVLTNSLSATLTTDEVADVFMEKGFELLNVQVGLVGLMNDDREVEVAGHHVPQNSTEERLSLINAATSLLEEVVQTRQPIWIKDATQWSGISDVAGESIQSAVGLPLMANRKLLGGIALGFSEPYEWDDDRQAFLNALAQQCAQAMERAQLHLVAQRTAAMLERQRLARELHDAVSQTLFAATTLAEGLPKAWERNPERGRTGLNDLITLIRAAMAEMRSLLLELRPEAIIRVSLSDLLEQLVSAAKGRKNIEGNLLIEGSHDQLNPKVHLALYRITQESINNILRHSQATEFSLNLRITGDAIELSIADNGLGFDMKQKNAGMGLNNIKEHAESSGGKGEIFSEPDGGTRITARWALQDA